ncbi:MAG TPA: outer membrane lipoprotein carrier protein LolA [Thermodesulfobacteriota bacterium]|nr:outer membrane lipoprotein carrier protein LolA [Thermodesulfobacteriota bacterium]
MQAKSDFNGTKFLALGAAFPFLLFAFVSISFAQDLPEIIRDIDARQRKIQTMSAQFTQKKETRLAEAPLLSAGTVKFKRPLRIHFTYTQPEAMEMAIDSRNLWVYDPGRFRAEKYPLANKRVAQYVTPVTAIFEKTFAGVAEDYDVSYLGSDGPNHVFRLHPRQAGKVISRADLRIDKDSGAILRFEMLDPGGDRLTLEFKNLRINVPIADEELSIQTPPAVKFQEAGP